MQRAARQRLCRAFRENGKSYAKAAASFGLHSDGKPVVNRGTVYKAVNEGKVGKKTAERMGITKLKRYYKNYRKREYYLRRWVRRHAK